MVAAEMDRQTKQPIKGRESAIHGLTLWWIYCGGRLRSVGLTYERKDGSEGIDEVMLIGLHVERYFNKQHPAWRALAKWAAANGWEMGEYPRWLCTDSQVASLGMPDLRSVRHQRRGYLLLDELLWRMATWLKDNPLPEPRTWVSE